MVILVYGEDEYRVKGRRQELMRAFTQKHDPTGMNVGRFCYPGEQDQAVQAMSSPPFLAKKRMVVLEGLASEVTRKEDAGVWAKRVCGRGDETVIVLVDDVTVDQAARLKLYVAIRAVESPVENAYGAMTPAQMEAFVRAEAKKVGTAWDAAAIKEVARRCGTDTWRLAEEVQKVSSSVAIGETVHVKDVVAIVPELFHDMLFSFLDAVRDRQSLKAIQLLQQELEGGVEPVQLFTMLEREVLLLCEIKAYMSLHGNDQSGAAKLFGLHPFVVKKCWARAAQADEVFLQNSVRAALKAEEAWKYNSIGERQALEQLVADLLEKT